MLHDCVTSKIFYAHRVKFYQKYSEEMEKERATAINSVTQKINSTLACNFISSLVILNHLLKTGTNTPDSEDTVVTLKPLKSEYDFFFLLGICSPIQHIVVEFGLFSQCWASQHKSTSLRYRQKSNKLILHLVFPVLLELMVDCANTFLPSCWCSKDSN